MLYYMYKVHRPGAMISPGYYYLLILPERSVSSPWTSISLLRTLGS